MSGYEHEVYWAPIKELAEKQSYGSIKDFILKVEDPKEQVALLRFAVRGLMFREWAPKSLVPIVELGDLAIETALKIGEIDEANIICYNMSSNLADCWNDGFVRTKEHFEKGLNYAERALQFRTQLKKGPIPFSLAYWAQGIHQFFLQDFLAAEQSFASSLKYAVLAAQSENRPTHLTTEAPFFVVIEYGYLALARLAQGKAEAKIDYQNVISCFESMKEISEDARGDAEVGISQLQFVHSKLK